MSSRGSKGRRPHTGILALVCLCLVSCSSREDLDGRRRAPKGAGPQRADDSSSDESGPFAAPLAAEEAPVLVDLIAQRPMISAHRRGALVIDASSADFIKYVDGGLRRDWKRGVDLVEEDGSRHSAALVRGLGAELYFPYDEDPGGIAADATSVDIRFRARSAVPKQLVSIFLNEKKLLDLPMPEASWQSYAIEAPLSALQPGDNKLRFYFRSAGELAGERSAAAFERFVVGNSVSEELAYEREGRPDLGPSLRLDADGRLSLYLRVPDGGPRLRGRFVGESRGELAIREAGRGYRSLWSNESGKELDIDLSGVAGRFVRLDLLNSGPGHWVGLAIHGSPPAGGESPEAPRSNHILLWSVSSLRNDRLRDDSGEAFRRFAQQGASVDDALAAVPHASGAHASIMSGRLRTSSKLPEEVETLAEKLQEAGYATALISGNGFVNDTAGYAQGFGVYDNPMRRQHHFGARTLWRQAKRFLIQNRARKSFVYLATVEPHLPYRPSAEALAKEWPLPAPFPSAHTARVSQELERGRRSLTGEEKAYVRALYDSSVADVGDAFSMALGEIEELGMEGELTVILVGDHGEELFERGGFGHGSSLHQESLRVPMIFRVPGLDTVELRKEASSQDLYASVLDLAGIEESDTGESESVFAPPMLPGMRPRISGLPDGSRSLQLGTHKLVALASGRVHHYELERDAEENEARPMGDGISFRVLRASLALARAFEGKWISARWGYVTALKEAFARDQGL